MILYRPLIQFICAAPSLPDDQNEMIGGPPAACWCGRSSCIPWTAATRHLLAVGARHTELREPTKAAAGRTSRGASTTSRNWACWVWPTTRMVKSSGSAGASVCHFRLFIKRMEFYLQDNRPIDETGKQKQDSYGYRC
jgi:hypothetical protein